MESKSESLYVSGLVGVSRVSLQGEILCHAPLEGAGVLCAGKKSLFCADNTGAIWRLDKKTLLLQSVLCGGPGICDLCLSPDETRLYALLGDADSVLMIDCQKGRPLLLNHCGCNPAQMLLHGKLLAVAGGESGMVHLYDAKTLVCQREISVPGPVYSIAIAGGRLYALCLTPQLDTLLFALGEKDGERRWLCGMPGAMAVYGECLYAATQGRVYVLNCQNMEIVDKIAVLGRPSRMSICDEKVVVYDPVSEGIYALHSDRYWQILAANVKSFCTGSNGFRLTALDL